MKNPFEHNAVESGIETELLKKVEEKAEAEIEGLEECNREFLRHEKKHYGLEEPNLEMEAEIREVQEKYQSHRKRFKSSFLSKLNNISRWLVDMSAILALTVHFGQQEYPDYLNKKSDKEPNKIEWNESTQKEIEDMAHEYMLIMKTDSVYTSDNDSFYKDVPDSVFENRFIDFVATWGPDINIVHPENEMDLGNAIQQLLFEAIPGQSATIPHYALNNTLVYPNRPMERDSGAAKYRDPYNFLDFVAEFSHHINNDWNLRRSFAYADKLVSAGFNQRALYKDLYATEYQAHSVTQIAVAKYIFPDNHDLNIDFADTYNTYHEYYRQFLRTRGYETFTQIDDLNKSLLCDKDLPYLSQNKEIIFENLENMRNAIDEIDADEKMKSQLFELLTSIPLERENYDFDELITETQVIIEAREMALKSEEALTFFVQNLESRFREDSEYIYTSMTGEIFNKSFINKISGLTDQNHIEIVSCIYKLYIYGTAKAAEGNALGYGNRYSFNEDAVTQAPSQIYHALDQYDIYLENLSQTYYPLPESIRAKITESSNLSYFLYNMIFYIHNSNDVVEAEYTSNDLNPWQYEIVNKLQKGLQENHAPDLKRDFFEFNTGESPLIHILD